MENIQKVITINGTPFSYSVLNSFDILIDTQFFLRLFPYLAWCSFMYPIFIPVSEYDQDAFPVLQLKRPDGRIC